MKNSSFLIRLMFVSLCFILFACSSDDGGDETPGSNNVMTINGTEHTISAIRVTQGTGFSGVDDSWTIVFADAIFAPDIDDDDYEGNGHGIEISYVSDNDPIEIDTRSARTDEFMLRLFAYDGGDFYSSDPFDPNTQSLIISVDGDQVTITGQGQDADNSSLRFSFQYEGPSNIFN